MQSTRPINILDILCLLNKDLQVWSMKSHMEYKTKRLAFPWFLKIDDGLCTNNTLLTNWSNYGTIRTD